MGRISTAGQLDQRVILQLQGPARNELGERTDVWTNVGEVWARVEPLRAAAQFAAGQAQRHTTHIVTIRYREDIRGDGTWRLMHRRRGGVLQPMAIDGEPIDVDSRGDWLQINAIEGKRDGR